MRIGFVSHHIEGQKTLQFLIDNDIRITACFSLKSDILITKSGYYDYEDICKLNSIPFEGI